MRGGEDVNLVMIRNSIAGSSTRLLILGISSKNAQSKRLNLTSQAEPMTAINQHNVNAGESLPHLSLRPST